MDPIDVAVRILGYLHVDPRFRQYLEDDLSHCTGYDRAIAYWKVLIFLLSQS